MLQHPIDHHFRIADWGDPAGLRAAGAERSQFFRTDSGGNRARLPGAQVRVHSPVEPALKKPELLPTGETIPNTEPSVLDRPDQLDQQDKPAGFRLIGATAAAPGHASGRRLPGQPQAPLPGRGLLGRHDQRAPKPSHFLAALLLEQDRTGPRLPRQRHIGPRGLRTCVQRVCCCLV
jgi:hypothetical protein